MRWNISGREAQTDGKEMDRCMKKYLFLPLLFLGVLWFCSGCSGDNAADVMDLIGSAPAVKLEYAEGDDSVLCTSDIRLTQIATLEIEASDQNAPEEWIYRFTFYPNEICPKDREIVVLFGTSSMSIDGVCYTPRAGVPYSALLEWAQGQYEYRLS